MYKHQWHVVDALGILRERGLPVGLDLIGGAYPPALRRLREAIARVDPAGRFVSYVGAVPHADLPARYQQADVFVFASSCENMPNTLLEAMASGLPIACSDRGPMPEILGDAGIYFDPERPADIARAIEGLLTSATERARVARTARDRVEQFTWERCADDTLSFIVETQRHHMRAATD
jgi:glycosyltransferase involved in cell wall biosynthesis